MSSLFSRRRPAVGADGLAIATSAGKQPRSTEGDGDHFNHSTSSLAASSDLGQAPYLGADGLAAAGDQLPRPRQVSAASASASPASSASPNGVRKTVSHFKKRLAFNKSGGAPKARGIAQMRARAPSPESSSRSSNALSDIRRPSGLGPRRANSFDGSLLSDSPVSPQFGLALPPTSPFKLEVSPRFPRAYPVEQEIMPVRKSLPPPPKIKLTARSPIATGGFGFAITDLENADEDDEDGDFSDTLSLPRGDGRIYGAHARSIRSTPNLHNDSGTFTQSSHSRSRSPPSASIAPTADGLSLAPTNGHGRSPSLAPSSAPTSGAHSRAVSDATSRITSTSLATSEGAPAVIFAFPRPPLSPAFAADSQASDGSVPPTPGLARATRVPIPASPLPGRTSAEPVTPVAVVRPTMFQFPPAAHRASLAPSEATSTQHEYRFPVFPSETRRSLPPAEPVAFPSEPEPVPPPSEPEPETALDRASSTYTPSPPMTRARKRMRLNPPVPLSLLFVHIPRHELPTLALVSRRFRTAAQAALYETISLPLQAGTDDGASDGASSSGPDDDELSARTDACVAHLAASPELASLVQSFVLALPPAHAAPGGTFDAALCLALRNMTHLRALALPHVPGFLSVCAGAGLPLERLRLAGARVRWADMVRVAPRLRRLEVPGVLAAGPAELAGVAMDALEEVCAQPEVVAVVAGAAGGLRRAEVLIESTIYEGLRPSELVHALAVGRADANVKAHSVEGGTEDDETASAENSPSSDAQHGAAGRRGRGVSELVLFFGRGVDSRTRGKVLQALGKERALARRLEVLEVHLDGQKEKDFDEVLYRQIAGLLPHTPALRDLRLPEPIASTSTAASATSDTHMSLDLGARRSLARAVSLQTSSNASSPRSLVHELRPASIAEGTAVQQGGGGGPPGAARIAQWARLAPALEYVSFAGAAEWTPVMKQERSWVRADA